MGNGWSVLPQMFVGVGVCGIERLDDMYIYIYIHTYTHTDMHTCIYYILYIYIYIHTYIHLHAQHMMYNLLSDPQDPCIVPGPLSPPHRR